MTDLLARVEAATGPDLELDYELSKLAGWTKDNTLTIGPMLPGYWYATDRGMPAYTASVDHALALVERKRPGARLYLVQWDDWHADFLTQDVDGKWWLDAESSAAGAHAPTAPLAILAALLKSLDQS